MIMMPNIQQRVFSFGSLHNHFSSFNGQLNLQILIQWNIFEPFSNNVPAKSLQGQEVFKTCGKMFVVFTVVLMQKIVRNYTKICQEGFQLF